MRWLAFAAAAVGLLVSCGGGGGGGGGSFSVSFDRSALSFESIEGSAAKPQTILATGSGDPGGTIYAVALIEGQGVASTGVSFSFSGSQANISITPRSDLAPGSYSGRLILQACADPQCTRQFSGSPHTVSYTNVVRARLRATPNPVALSAAAGETRTTRIAVVPTEGVGTFSTSVINGSEWLRVENQNATGFDLVTQPLPGGTYMGAVQVSSGPITQVLQVPLAVTAASAGDTDISLSTSALTINVAATGSSQQTLTVKPPTWTPQMSASIEYQSGTGWLTLTRGDGTSWTVSANALMLGPGTYSARATFRSTYPSQPRVLNVTIVVGAGLVLPVQRSVVVTADTQASDLTGSFPVAVAGGVPFTWTAKTTAPWLQLTVSSGSSDVPIAWAVNQNALSGLANFTDNTAIITVTTSLPTVPAGQTALTLSRRLPELHQITPYLLVRERSERIIVRGRGFDGVLDPASRLSFEGVTPTSVTRLNDRQLIVHLPPVAAATVRAQATNSLGIATDSVTLKSVSAVSRAYAFVRGVGGFTRSLIHDGERDALFATQSSATQSVVRLARNGVNWAMTPIAAADVYDVGLAPDGNALLMAMTSGELRSLNPITGSENTALRLTLPNSRLTDDREFFVAQGLTITADGLMWLPIDQSAGSPFKVLTTVDLRTRERVAHVATSNNFTFYRGPLFATPRDGGRMLGRQNSGVSGPDSTYDALRYDTATGNIGRTTKLRSLFDMRFTNDGRLAFVNLSRVIDVNDDLHGLVRLPTGWQAVAGQISGSGTRVYLLAYPYRDPYDDPPIALGVKPRLFVYDSTAPSASTSGLPALGYAELNDFPSTCGDFSGSCWSGLASTISADGNTLFFLGTNGLVVMPVPTTLRPVASSASQPVTWRR